MSKHLRTARSRVTNRGPLAKFIGLLPTNKSPSGVLAFNSITEMFVGVFLTWAPSVAQVTFEKRPVVFEATTDLPGISAWPDFEIAHYGGQIEWVEAKYSEASLRPQERDRLEVLQAHFQATGTRHRIVHREELEKDGFIGTIMLLRRYGLLDYSASEVEHALRTFADSPPTHIEGWELRAREKLVPLDLIYHLLYHQRLPLTYRPLLPPSLRLCRE